MPENRKYYPHKSVLLCTSRTEIGLPFVASLIVNFLLWGILAKAKEKFSVKICHFIFLANHFHMLLVVDNPEDISQFIGYVKAESAHAINRLLGRRKRTVWEDGYDSPLILTASDVMKWIRYIYLNPVKAFLVDSIAEYPGVSSWDMFVRGSFSRVCKRISRKAIHALWNPALSINEQKRVVAGYQYLEGSNHEFLLEPNAWMECFPELADVSVDEMNAQLLADIRREEVTFAEHRKRDRKNVIGSTALRRESMTKEYIPTKFGRKSICLCHDRGLRHAFIQTFKNLCKTARMIYSRWRFGELSLKIPPGLFAPRVPTLACALPISP